jgi:hypothetical protein
MGRLRLTAEQTIDGIADIGDYVFRKPSKIPNELLFDNDKLRSTIVSVLERHGFNADTKMIEEPAPDSQCRVYVKLY